MGRYQEGHLVKRFGGWHVRYYVTENGTRKQKSHRLCDDSQTKSHVKQLRDEFMQDHVNIGVENSGPMGVVEFWDKVYLPFIESTNNLKPSTVHGYKQLWNQRLKDHFGTTSLAEYKTPMMTRFLTDLAADLRPRTLNHIKWLASAVFAHAIALGHCDTNPIRDAKVLGKTKQPGATKHYTLEEIENIITALVDSPMCQLIMALSYFLGLRKGEITALQWGDVDSDFIHIRRNWTRGVITTPKTKKSVRSLPLLQPVRGLLNLWRAKAGDGVWMFTNERGGPQDLDPIVAKIIRPALAMEKLEWKGFHAGRRGLGTVLRQITGNSTAGRDVLGHEDEVITKNHYEGALPEGAHAALKQLEAKTLNK